jgi:hypothetical protein
MFILSMYDIQARGVTVPNAIIGMASFVGGLSLFVAGMLGMLPTTFSQKGTNGLPHGSQNLSMATCSLRVVSIFSLLLMQ